MMTDNAGAQSNSDDRQAMSRRREEKRESARIKHGEAARLYNVDKIGARIVTEQQSYDATLLDLSAGGAAIITVSALPINLPVDIELRVGDHCIRALGVVKNRNKLGVKYRLGVQFTRLDPEEHDFLLLLYGPGGMVEERDGIVDE
ncbi:MAG: PilZ domain-containing protein [bacterium]|nr:PilZ domain-containing protein [bacterium]